MQYDSQTIHMAACHEQLIRHSGNHDTHVLVVCFTLVEHCSGNRITD